VKVGIICSGWAFMSDLVTELKNHHTISILKEPFTTKRVKQFIEKLDLLYVEWCASYLITVTHLPKKCKIVCRLHGHEVRGSWMKNIIWSKLDLMIFVNEHPLRIFRKAYPHVKVKTSIVRQGVNMEKFTYSPGRGFGKRIGFVGCFRPRKDPLPVINMMSKLPRWSLYVRSDRSAYPKMEKACLKRIQELPDVHHIPHLEDMNQYYHRLDILVNNSLYESQGIAILEAMACQVYPLIRDWPKIPGAAGKLYPKENIFTSIDECRSKILRWVQLSVEEKRMKGLNMRKFIEKHYDAKDYVRNMRKTIESA